MAVTVNERDYCGASQRFLKPNQGLSKKRALPLMLKKLSHSPPTHRPLPSAPLPGQMWLLICLWGKQMVVHVESKTKVLPIWIFCKTLHLQFFYYKVFSINCVSELFGNAGRWFVPAVKFIVVALQHVPSIGG